VICDISFTGPGSGQKDGGFDGIIFTTDLAFVPDEGDGPGVCQDDDEYTAGACTETNWGPNTAPAPGRCRDDLAVADDLSCSTGGDTCCAGVCVSGPCP